jgi:hypothetical protein
MRQVDHRAGVKAEKIHSLMAYQYYPDELTRIEQRSCQQHFAGSPTVGAWELLNRGSNPCIPHSRVAAIAHLVGSAWYRSAAEGLCLVPMQIERAR